MEAGTIYDIISRICDHELAEVITSKMRKHTEEKEGNGNDQEKGKEGKENEQHKENSPPHSSPNPSSKKAPAARPRQTLGEYYISHPPPKSKPYSQEPYSQQQHEEYTRAWQEWVNWENRDTSREGQAPPITKEKKKVGCLLACLLGVRVVVSTPSLEQKFFGLCEWAAHLHLALN